MSLRCSFHFLFLDKLRALWLITPKWSVRRLWRMKIQSPPIQCSHLIGGAFHWFFSCTTCSIATLANVDYYSNGLVSDICPELLNIFLMHLLILLLTSFIAYKLHIFFLWLLIYRFQCLQPLLRQIAIMQLLIKALQSLETEDWICERVAIGFTWK